MLNRQARLDQPLGWSREGATAASGSSRMYSHRIAISCFRPWTYACPAARAAAGSSDSLLVEAAAAASAASSTGSRGAPGERCLLVVPPRLLVEGVFLILVVVAVFLLVFLHWCLIPTLLEEDSLAGLGVLGLISRRACLFDGVRVLEHAVGHLYWQPPRALRRRRRLSLGRLVPLPSLAATPPRPLLVPHLVVVVVVVVVVAAFVAALIIIVVVVAA
jgi:hypothetical protein